MSQVYEFHPACLALPKMDDAEYQALRLSIRGGFDERHPILLHDGLILDGRHRYQACLEENVTPTFITWIGGDPFDFVRKEHDADASIIRWYVLDLAIFRANLINREDCLIWNSRINRDGQTEFVAFDVRSFTPDVLVASSHTVEFFPGAQAA